MLRNIDVALILTDVNMPGIDGVDLALRAQSLCPKTQILLMSGSETSETILRRPGCEGCQFQVIAKPFDSEQLLERIESALN